MFWRGAEDQLHELFRVEPKRKAGHFDARLMRAYVDGVRSDPRANDAAPPARRRICLPTRLYRTGKLLRSLVRGHPEGFYCLITVEQPRDRLLFLIEEVRRLPSLRPPRIALPP